MSDLIFLSRFPGFIGKAKTKSVKMFHFNQSSTSLLSCPDGAKIILSV